MTWTDAEITSGPNDGNTPRRQADFMFDFIPTLAVGPHSVGLSIIGQTDAYSQDINKLVLPAYAYINAFIRYQLTRQFFASVNGNNLLDTIGITESEEGSIVENQVNYVRGRPIPGRSITFSLGYDF